MYEYLEIIILSHQHIPIQMNQISNHGVRQRTVMFFRRLLAWNTKRAMVRDMLVPIAGRCMMEPKMDGL